MVRSGKRNIDQLRLFTGSDDRIRKRLIRCDNDIRIRASLTQFRFVFRLIIMIDHLNPSLCERFHESVYRCLVNPQRFCYRNFHNSIPPKSVPGLFCAAFKSLSDLIKLIPAGQHRPHHLRF